MTRLELENNHLLRRIAVALERIAAALDKGGTETDRVEDRDENKN